MKFTIAVLSIIAASSAVAGNGPLGIDHMLNRDEHSIWSRRSQLALEMGSAAVVLGGALWEGSDSRLGRTLWQSTDAMIVGAISAEAGKRIFRRQRPINGNDPNAWFHSTTDKSFPSGEVTHITAVVTPLIAEYHHEYPAVWALAALPVYDGIARMKSQAHWQTDVLAGAALGLGVGLYAHGRPESLMVGVLPGGLTVGFKRSF